MIKLSYFFISFFLIISSLSFVSSNFACGFVNDSQTLSSSWINVMVYFEENVSDFTECKINPDNKFCCDLENISSVEFVTGKKVFAEVDDREEGIVGGPVSLYLTESGYDVFPEMRLEKAIVTNFNEQNIFVNKSSILINLSLAEGYNNLKYIVNSSEGSLEQEVCSNCRSTDFSVPLFKGRNEILLISNGSREISEKIIIYNLDYFNFNLSCDKCKLKRGFFYIPSEEEITIHSYFNASHNLSGDFLFYIPSQWDLQNSPKSEDFSITHRGFREEINNKKEFSVDYVVKSPKALLKQDYFFYQKLNEYELLTKVRVFNIKLIPFHKINKFEKNYPKGILEQKTSSAEPIILNSKENYLKLVAIFPKKEILKTYSYLKFDEKKHGKNKEYFFTILTSIPQEDIDRIFLIFRAEKGKFLEFYINSNKIPLDLYQEDSNFTYYSAYVTEKGPFRVKIF